ncbi:MAG: glycine dehydrogenase (aminomethyl-transferring), partial [Frankia sp.]
MHTIIEDGTGGPASGSDITMDPTSGRPGDGASGARSTAGRATFVDRHIGPGPTARQAMLNALGYADLDALTTAAVPAGIRDTELVLPPAGSEPEILAELRALAARNRAVPSMIGLGYHPAVMPGVIQRNVLESPAWYTAYTPYQPEISQGRLEALINFQTMIADLTGLPTAGASL